MVEAETNERTGGTWVLREADTATTRSIAEEMDKVIRCRKAAQKDFDWAPAEAARISAEAEKHEESFVTLPA